MITYSLKVTLDEGGGMKSDTNYPEASSSSERENENVKGKILLDFFSSCLFPFVLLLHTIPSLSREERKNDIFFSFIIYLISVLFLLRLNTFCHVLSDVSGGETKGMKGRKSRMSWVKRISFEKSTFECFFRFRTFHNWHDISICAFYPPILTFEEFWGVNAGLVLIAEIQYFLILFHTILFSRFSIFNFLFRLPHRFFSWHTSNVEGWKFFIHITQLKQLSSISSLFKLDITVVRWNLNLIDVKSLEILAREGEKSEKSSQSTADFSPHNSSRLSPTLELLTIQSTHNYFN